MPPKSSSRASARSACATPEADAAAKPPRCAPARRLSFPAAPIIRRSCLQLSGVGPAALLQSLGIPVRHALSGVGEGLQDHYAPRSVARVKNIKTINERARGFNLALEALKWATTRRGILALSPTPGLLLLALRRDRRKLRPAAHLHAGKLHGRRTGQTGKRTRHVGRVVAAAAGEPRPCPPPLVRSVRRRR